MPHLDPGQPADQQEPGDEQRQQRAQPVQPDRLPRAAGDPVQPRGRREREHTGDRDQPGGSTAADGEASAATAPASAGPTMKTSSWTVASSEYIAARASGPGSSAGHNARATWRHRRVEHAAAAVSPASTDVESGPHGHQRDQPEPVDQRGAEQDGPHRPAPVDQPAPQQRAGSRPDHPAGADQPHRRVRPGALNDQQRHRERTGRLADPGQQRGAERRATDGVVSSGRYEAGSTSSILPGRSDRIRPAQDAGGLRRGHRPRAAAWGSIAPPQPPPPGVTMATTPPPASSRVAFGGSVSSPSRLRPGRPSPPPQAPRGACRRRSVSSDSVARLSTRTRADAVAAAVAPGSAGARPARSARPASGTRARAPRPAC